ncbi:hypothetical protein, partial [Escherichia coli]|uniref:hypothetical protein n=1 Tax=Escherichia coli TaxID=562 RepID=UPI00195452CB
NYFRALALGATTDHFGSKSAASKHGQPGCGASVGIGEAGKHPRAPAAGARLSHKKNPGLATGAKVETGGMRGGRRLSRRRY